MRCLSTAMCESLIYKRSASLQFVVGVILDASSVVVSSNQLAQWTAAARLRKSIQSAEHNY